MTLKKILILFDFDGTITKKDTLIEFIRYYHGDFKFILGFIALSPVLLLYKLKLIPNWEAKESVLVYFFKNERLEVFNRKCKDFAEQVVSRLIRPAALHTIHEYLKKNNHYITVVSASPENWVKPWCDRLTINCIATRLEISNDRLTGKISGKNCYGKEKVTRICEKIDLSHFDKIIVYGDSSGDKEMLDLAHEAFYKPFRE